MSYEVDRPILNNPFDEPPHYEFIRDGYDPELREGRRPAIAYPPVRAILIGVWGEY